MRGIHQERVKPNLLKYGDISPDLALFILWRVRRHLLVWGEDDLAAEIRGLITDHFGYPEPAEVDDDELYI